MERNSCNNGIYRRKHLSLIVRRSCCFRLSSFRDRVGSVASKLSILTQLYMSRVWPPNHRGAPHEHRHTSCLQQMFIANDYTPEALPMFLLYSNKPCVFSNEIVVFKGQKQRNVPALFHHLRQMQSLWQKTGGTIKLPAHCTCSRTIKNI